MIDQDKLEGPLVVRSRKDGDHFQPFGGSGAKKLGDFFTDAKVPPDDRDQIGILCDARGIVWVLGMRISDRVKITPNTKKILKLTLK